jgi:hypothetical protein
MAEREIHVPVYGHYVVPNPPYMASRQLLIPRIATVGTSFSPQPCQASHGYGATNAHRVEMEVGADGHASAPPSGAVAATPPAGASVITRSTSPQIQHSKIQIVAKAQGYLISQKLYNFSML